MLEKRREDTRVLDVSFLPYAHMVGWDRLLGVVRSRYPKLGKYGGDEGGDANKVLALVGNPTELERIAEAVFRIDATYEADTAAARQTIEAAGKKQSAALMALLETMPT